MRIVFFLFLLFFTGIRIVGQSNTSDANAWITNGTVNSVVYSNEKVYLGGDFTHVGPAVPFGTILNNSTGLPNMSYAAPNGTVLAVLADGSGGWYIGGDFTTVGGVTRNRLARINSDGTLHDWNPDADNTVNTLLISGSTIYVGGNFTNIGGQTRNRIAALDASTGLATAWNPNASAIVNAIAVSGSNVYVGGNFTTIGGQTRNRIAALDASTGLATAWNPNASGTVNAIAVSGSTIYVGGTFATIGGQSRNRIAALDASTGSASAWNPNVTGGSINKMVLDGNNIYIGGTFTLVAGTTRNRIAALDATATGTALSPYLISTWNPSADDQVTSLLISGTTLYVGGFFSSIGGQSRARIAALDANTGSATNWNPKAGDEVRALAVNGTSVYVGGNFTIIGGEVRNYLARFDAATGQADSWNPNANSTVRTMLMSAGNLYVGGTFTTIGVTTRNRIAAISEVDGTLTSFDPNVINGEVSSLAIDGSTVYLGGTFNGANSINGNTTRNRLAAVDATSGVVVTNWDPNVTGKVNAIAVYDSKVYFGGQFTGANAINGNTTRNYLAAVNVSDGIVTSWDPNTNGEVFAVAANGGQIYVAGNSRTFTRSGQTVTRNYLAALHPTTGVPTNWNPNPANTVSTMAFNSTMVYVGRGFNSIGGSTRQNAAGVLLNINTNNATSWYPTPATSVFSIAVGGNKVFLGGSFSTVSGLLRVGYAAYSIDSLAWNGSVSTDWNNAANWTPNFVPSTGATVTIPSGLTNYPVPPSTITISSLIVSSGVSFALGSSVLTITGNLTNNGTITGSGKLTMNSTQAQTISGTGSISNLEISKSSGTVTLSGDQTLSGDLTLSSGKLFLGNNTLTVTGSISGASSSNYIATTGTGTLLRNITNGSSFTFPVGNSTYNPITIDNTGTTDNFWVQVADQVLDGGTSGTAITDKIVNRTWLIGKTNASTNAGVNITLQWEQNEELGTITNHKLSHYGSSWALAAGISGSVTTSGTTKTMTHTGYTGTFSPFSIGGEGSVLPVTWLSFTGKKVQQGVELRWSTSSEQNTKDFQVQHSINAQQWTTVSSLPSAGNSNTVRNYRFVHEGPFKNSKQYYYRILQRDLDDKFSYSNVIRIENTEGVTDVVVYPNPASDLLHVDLTERQEIKLVNLQGVVVWKGVLPAGRHDIPVSNFATGNYILQAGKRTYKVVIQ